MESQKEKLGIEASKVIEEFINYRNSDIGAALDSRTKVAKFASFGVWFIGIGLLLFGTYAGTDSWLLQPENRQLYYIILLFVVLLAAMFMYLDVTRSGAAGFLRDPVNEALGWTKEGLAFECHIYERLDQYSTEAIVQANAMIKRKMALANSASSMLVGALNKVGIIPAVIAILLAVSKVADATEISIFEYLAFALIGMYFTSFRTAEIALKFADYERLFDQYLLVRGKE